ncbi:MAG TPA: folylpolyglutamate synthase/dihydrofolate synthase family protein [Candidatus Sulfotelmatobacter sp.]|nr:folylpolyglutamate synthase/dihydrofolate synthase family protein [Candidatus Sulfotelmatobacter sp.]
MKDSHALTLSRSQPPVSYPDAIQFLYGLRLFGAKLGLENTFKLAALAGHPEKRLRFIHVAGTNGKGSTCAMLESIYRQAGLRTGLFTSPHLVSFRERIQVRRELISEQDVVRLVEKFRRLLADFSNDHHPTFFEVVTVMALDFFAEQNCDLVIWETGLGGRLDATNVVTPLACAITNIALDHQQWLGDTLEKIAFEKAGIIKPGIPIATTAAEPNVLAVIRDVAIQKKAPLTIVDADIVDRFPDALSLRGGHQKRNAALALAVVNLLQREIPVSAKQIADGLRQVHWPGRLQLLQQPDGRKLLLDGAHNIAGAEALREAVEKEFQPRKKTLILGIFGDKDWRQICGILAPLAAEILTVPVSSQRTANPNDLTEACRAANPSANVSVCHSLGEALQKSTPDHFIIITGSLYLIGEALELFGYVSSAKSERDLNEWGADTLKR